MPLTCRSYCAAVARTTSNVDQACTTRTHCPYICLFQQISHNAQSNNNVRFATRRCVSRWRTRIIRKFSSVVGGGYRTSGTCRPTLHYETITRSDSLRFNENNQLIHCSNIMLDIVHIRHTLTRNFGSGANSRNVVSISYQTISNWYIDLLKPTGHVMHQQFNIQQLYALPTLYLCVLYLSENKQRLVPLTA